MTWSAGRGFGGGPVTVTITQVGLTAANSTLLNSPYDIQKLGDFVFVDTNNGRISSVDVSDPTTPVIESTLTDATQEILNNSRGSALNAPDELLYVVGTTVGSPGYVLAIIDISNPASMSIVGSVDDADLQSPTGIAYDPVDEVCYVVGALGLSVVDVSTPATPSVIGTETTFTDLRDVVCEGNFAYATAASDNRLIVFDVATPSTPSVEGSVQNATTLNAPRHLSKSGDFLYIACQAGDRLTVVDVSTSTAPTVAGSITGATFDAVFSTQIDGTRCYVGGGTGADFLSVVDVSSPSSMSVLATAAVVSYPINFVKDGNFIYGTDSTTHRVRVWEIESTGGSGGWSVG